LGGDDGRFVSPTRDVLGMMSIMLGWASTAEGVAMATAQPEAMWMWKGNFMFQVR